MHTRRNLLPYVLRRPRASWHDGFLSVVPPRLLRLAFATYPEQETITDARTGSPLRYGDAVVFVDPPKVTLYNAEPLYLSVLAVLLVALTFNMLAQLIFTSRQRVLATRTQARKLKRLIALNRMTHTFVAFSCAALAWLELKCGTLAPSSLFLKLGGHYFILLILIELIFIGGSMAIAWRLNKVPIAAPELQSEFLSLKNALWLPWGALSPSRDRV